MKKDIHGQLQKSINNMQKQNNEITILLMDYAYKLGKAIGYKHKDRPIYRIIVGVGDKNYDMYDLLEQTLAYIKEKQ